MVRYYPMLHNFKAKNRSSFKFDTNPKFWIERKNEYKFFYVINYNGCIKNIDQSQIATLLISNQWQNYKSLKFSLLQIDMCFKLKLRRKWSILKKLSHVN